MADIGYIKGYYPSEYRTLPTTPGFEGSGTVVQLGPDIKDKTLLNKRVAFGSFFSNHGTFA
jgi:NADPH:quinone reductase-like Zn-dependent oxidoreductase